MANISIMETFVANLKAVIDAAGIKQKDLCKRAGILQPNLSRLLTKADNVTLAIASELSNAVGYPLHKLLDPDFLPPKASQKDVAA